MPRPQKTEADRARDRRSWMIAGGCLAFAILIFVVTIMRLKGQPVAPHF